MSLDKFLTRAERTKEEFGTATNEFLFKTANWHKVITALREAKGIIELRNLNMKIPAEKYWLEKWDKEFSDDR